MDYASSILGLLPTGRRSIGVTQLLNKLETYLPPAQVDRIRDAYEFGAEAHEYDVSDYRAVLCPVGVSAPVQIRAQSDGTLWLDSPAPQPEGFPLRPSRVSDLTGSPSNNSFKPKPLRGSA